MFKFSRAYEWDDFPKAEVDASFAAGSAAFGEAEEVDDLDLLPLTEATKQIIREGRIEFESKAGDDSPSVWRFQGVCEMVRAGLRNTQILGILLDERFKIGLRGDGTRIREARARGDITKARKQVEQEQDDSAMFDAGPIDGDSSTAGRANRFANQSLADLIRLQPLQYLVESTIPVNCLFEIFGKQKSGKTFYAIELGLCIATGHDFFGFATRQGKVLHIVAEGSLAKIRDRVLLWLQKRFQKQQRDRARSAVEGNWAVVGIPVHIDVPATLTEFLRANPGSWDVIIIDTLFRNTIGHVNDQKEMAAFVRGCDVIREQTGAAVLIIHHERREKAEGGFGSIVIEAAVDGAARVSRKGNKRIFQVAMLRNDDDTVPAIVCELESGPVEVRLGEDDVTSAVLRYVGTLREKPVDRLIRALAEADIDSPEDLVEETGISRTQVFEHLKTIREEGYLPKKGLKLTEKGREYAERLIRSDEPDFG